MNPVVNAETMMLASALLDFSLLLRKALICTIDDGIDSKTISMQRDTVASDSMLNVAFLSFSSFAASRTACGESVGKDGRWKGC